MISLLLLVWAGAIAGLVPRRQYHAPLYYAGGALMLLLAAYSLFGRMWSLPSVLRARTPNAATRRAFRPRCLLRRRLQLLRPGYPPE